MSIEIPRGGFVKRRADGTVDFVSPVPCPFNYGSVIGSTAADGDPVDALVLGARLPRGHRRTWQVHGSVAFVDDGMPDEKLVCSDHPPSRAERAAIMAFFKLYARCKRLLHRARGRSGWTGSKGWRST